MNFKFFIIIQISSYSIIGHKSLNLIISILFDFSQFKFYLTDHYISQSWYHLWEQLPHIAVFIHYTYKRSYLIFKSLRFNISIACIILSVGFTPLCVTQIPKYSIFVFLKNFFSMLHLSHFSFSSFRVNFNFCTWSFLSLFVNNKRSSIYTQINSNPWNKSLIVFYKMSGDLETPIGRRL